MIPKNAITMRGTIDRCWLVAFRADIDLVRKELPPQLEPVTYGGFAYLGLVVSHLSQMRPAPLPAWTGLSYWHVAYRIYAKPQNPFPFSARHNNIEDGQVPRDGKGEGTCPELAKEGGEGSGQVETEGLYFLRSDADSPLMVAAGNALTTFRFHQAKIEAVEQNGRTDLTVDSPTAPLRITLGSEPPAQAKGSPFASLEKAATFLKYKPAALSVDGLEIGILRITRDESAWRYRLRTIERLQVPFFERFNAVPEVAYEVDPIEYRWNRAVRLRVSK